MAAKGNSDNLVTFPGMFSILPFACLPDSKLMLPLLSTSHSFTDLMGTLHDINQDSETEEILYNMALSIAGKHKDELPVFIAYIFRAEHGTKCF